MVDIEYTLAKCAQANSTWQFRSQKGESTLFSIVKIMSGARKCESNSPLIVNVQYHVKKTISHDAEDALPVTSTKLSTKRPPRAQRAIEPRADAPQTSPP